ncbi:MAG: phospho-N-acetylmuramoyl-pentapeptide-transferase [Ruminococcaceae bacterium]|nr:phospho-N-acetylmuramoyl-pentapeptide-transferase [Oscillospiraceae bacterium]
MNVFLAMLLALLISFVLSAVLGIRIVPWLHKLKFGQTILDIGPNWHKAKQGTPTMGGFMFIISTIVTFILLVVVDYFMGGDLIAGALPSAVAGATKVKIYSALMLGIGFGFIGFCDDYIKVVKKQNEGLTIMQKTMAQLALSIAYVATMCLSGEQYMYLPFVDNAVTYGHPIVFAIVAIVVIYSTVNAVNFTDGIDGLCASVTATAAFSFAIIAALMKVTGACLLSCVLAGACAGYLIWNWHPAKCFMGDTGSMFLGGIIAGLAFAIESPLLLLLVGIIYVIEGLSDVIQIVYFKITRRIARRKDPKATGKRLFKMAPIHHHFEKVGWSEEKIVIVFSIINLIGGLLACLLVYKGI